MQLMTKEIMQKMPPCRSTDGQGDEADIIVKFFTPDSNWTWWTTEGNPVVVRDGEKVEVEEGISGVRQGEEIVDWLLFGLVQGFEKELGYFMLSELQNATGPMGLHIERDRHFSGKKLKDVR